MVVDSGPLAIKGNIETNWDKVLYKLFSFNSIGFIKKKIVDYF